MSQSDTNPYVIGIAGCSGSGKTFFLKCFLDHFKNNEITLVSQDDYYFPANTKTKEENRLYNFDLPKAIDRASFYKDVKTLISGGTIYREEYTFNNPALKPKMLEIKSAPILVVEGLFIFHYKEIDALLDYRIFMHANNDIALERRLKRDFEERGYDAEDVLYKWHNHVIPAFNTYLLPYKKQCNQIIENNTDDPRPIQEISQDISAYLRKFFF